MLMQNEVRAQLDAIAEEILQSPGMYHELYSRVYSERIQGWMRAVPHADARIIERIVESDPDYLPEIEATVPLHTLKANPLFNPAWDVQY